MSNRERRKFQDQEKNNSFSRCQIRKSLKFFNLVVSDLLSGGSGTYGQRGQGSRLDDASCMALCVLSLPIGLRPGRLPPGHACETVFVHGNLFGLWLTRKAWSSVSTTHVSPWDNACRGRKYWSMVRAGPSLVAQGEIENKAVCLTKKSFLKTVFY